MSAGGRDVYGLRLSGLDEVVELAPASTSGDGSIEVHVRQVDDALPALAAPDSGRAVLRLADGRHLELRRDAGTATYHGPPGPLDLLAHPGLAPVATTFSRWAGREAFHAGAFVLAGRAWAVLGPRTAGKSSLLAALAARGVPVLSDDIVVTDGVDAFAGPRCLDLREPLPGISLPTTPARRRTRDRVLLPPLEPRTPLGGWLFLGWGAAGLSPIAPDELLTRLAVRRSWRALASDPLMLLRLGTLPAWDLTRPRDWSVVPATVDRLLTTLSAAAPPALVAA